MYVYDMRACARFLIERAIFLNWQVAAARKERSLSHLFIPLKSIGQNFHTGDSHGRTAFVCARAES